MRRNDLPVPRFARAFSPLEEGGEFFLQCGERDSEHLSARRHGEKVGDRAVKGELSTRSRLDGEEKEEGDPRRCDKIRGYAADGTGEGEIEQSERRCGKAERRRRQRGSQLRSPGRSRRHLKMRLKKETGSGAAE